MGLVHQSSLNAERTERVYNTCACVCACVDAFFFLALAHTARLLYLCTSMHACVRVVWRVVWWPLQVCVCGVVWCGVVRAGFGFGFTWCCGVARAVAAACLVGEAHHSKRLYLRTLLLTRPVAVRSLDGFVH